MQALVDAIRQQGEVLPGGILKVDGLVNHQLLPHLTREMGEVFAAHFAPLNPGKIVTIEVSGIAPAIATAMVLGVPMVYARKKKPVTMKEPAFTAQSVSRTKGGVVDLFISSEFLGAGDRVVVIDDFLASGGTLRALAGMIEVSGAELLGIGCVVESSCSAVSESVSALSWRRKPQTCKGGRSPLIPVRHKFFTGCQK